MEHFKRLGTEKQKTLDDNFDMIYQKYKDKAEKLGFKGDLKFVKERGKVIFYVVI